jgi:hypothetical protein
MSLEDLQKIIANPFYAIEISPDMCQPHPPMISEDEWVRGNAKLIEELGAEKVLKLILENLKGNFVTNM